MYWLLEKLKTDDYHFLSQFLDRVTSLHTDEIRIYVDQTHLVFLGGQGKGDKGKEEGMIGSFRILFWFALFCFKERTRLFFSTSLQADQY